LTSGAFTFVEVGTANAGKGFVASVSGQVPMATITWTQFSEAGSLTAGSGIYIADGAISVNVNVLAGPGLASSFGQLVIDQYATGVRYNGGGDASVTTDTLYATTATSNTYVTLGTIGANKAFTLDVLMNVGSLFRKSTISGVTDSAGIPRYTEYAIVDTDTPITEPDFYIEHDFLNNASFIKVKATLDVDSLYVVINSQIISLVS
jgi:hypothetical protein